MPSAFHRCFSGDGFPPLPATGRAGVPSAGLGPKSATPSTPSPMLSLDSTLPPWTYSFVSTDESMKNTVFPSYSDTQGIAPILMLPRTYQPSVVRRKRRFGFLKRNSTPSGRRVLLRRRIKGRANAT